MVSILGRVCVCVVGEVNIFCSYIPHKYLRAAEEKQNGYCQHIVTNNVTLWAASYSACVVYTKTIVTSMSVKVVDIYLHFVE